MQVFKSAPHFNAATGEKESDRKVFDCHRCDYCGEIIEFDQLTYRVDYAESDPCFDSGKGEYSLKKLLGEVSSYDVYNDPYVFCGSYNGADRKFCECNLMFEVAAAALHSDDAYLAKIEDFQSAFRSARARSIKRLIKEGTITAEQLVSPDE